MSGRTIKDPPIGAPRKYDLYKEAKDLEEWSKKPDSFNLKSFTNDKDYCASELSAFAALNPCFGEALKKTKERIAVRREEGVVKNTYNYGIWNRYASHIDDELDKHEWEKRKRELDYTKGMESQLPPNELALQAQQALIEENARLKKELDEFKSKAATQYPGSD